MRSKLRRLNFLNMLLFFWHMEESSDYIDCYALFRRLVKRGELTAVITKHAIERLRERRLDYPWRERKDQLIDIIRNILRSGKYKILVNRVIIWTRRYTLICALNESGELVILTVISRRDLSEKLVQKLKGGFHVKWKNINIRS